MSKRVKGIVVEIGGNTAKLDKTLAGTNTQLGSTQASLKDVERLLKLDPKNTKLLEQKQRLLATAVSETEKKLETLNQANEQAAKSVKNYDAWKAAYDPIQAEITTTYDKLKDLRKAQKEMEDLGEVDSDAYRKLTDEIQTASKELKDLRQKAKDVNEEFGNPISQEQYDALQREIIETEQKLGSLKTRSDEANKALARISGESLDDVQSMAQRAKQKLEDMGEAAQEVKQKADGIADAFKPVTTAVTGLAVAAAATIPATEELRDDLSKLDANAKENAVSADVAREAWKKFAVQSGETDSAVEAVSNLLQANFTESNLQKAVEGLAGAAIRFPDTLKVESLADSLQETLASGAATGQFSELLSRLGMDAQAFSDNLKSCGTEAEKQNLILQTLADAGLNNAYNAWHDTNSEMLENKEANLELQQSMAQMAEVVLPIVTDITSAMAAFVGWFANLPEPAQMTIMAILGVVAAISPMASAVSGAAGLFETLSKVNIPGLGTAFGTLTGTILPGIQGVFSSVFGFIAANPVVLLIAAIVGLIAIIAANSDKAKQILNGVSSFVSGVFTGNWKRAWEGVVAIFSGIFSSIKSVAKGPINAVISMVNKAIGGVNFVGSALSKLPGVNIGAIGKIPMLADGGTVYSGNAIVGEAGPELLTVTGGRAVVRPLANTQNHSGAVQHNHTGTIRVEGVNTRGEMVGVMDMLIDELRQEVRR